MEKRSSFAPPAKGTSCTMCSIESTFVPKGMIPCPDCDDAVYCSPECREWHWDNQHQHECQGRHDEVVEFDNDDDNFKAEAETQSATSSDSYDHAQNTTITMLNQHNPNPLAEDPCSRLQRIYSEDNGFIDKEFDHYAQAYYDKRQQEREEERQSKWYNCKGRLSPLVFWGLVIQVVVIFVLSIVYATMEKGQQPHNNNRPSGTNTTLLLDPPPTDLLKICNADAIATPKGRKACQEVCDPVQCCYMSETNPQHCWRDNLKTCHEYRKACAVLSPLKDKYNNSNRAQAPPAPTTTVYPNALVLWDNPKLLPPAPSTLMETCQAGFLLDDPWSQKETTGATLTCHELCYRASCCWDSRLAHPADRCWTHQNCAGYAAACSHLLRDSHVSGAKSVLALQTQAQQHPAVVANSCLHARSNLNDLLHCQQACLPSECCWNSAFVDNCKDESQCNAETTEACQVLSVPLPLVIGGGSQETASISEAPTSSSSTFTMGNDITTPTNTNTTDATMYSKESIRDACWNHDNSIRTPGHKSLCEQVCQAGSCCYNEDEQCPDYLPEEFCSKYEPCTIIAIQDQNSLKTQIETACANRNDLSECVQLCGTGTCCYTNDPWKTCITTQPDTICSDYAGCEVLYGVMQDKTSLSSGANGANRRRQLRRTSMD